MPTTTRVNLQANRRGSGSARAEIQVAHSAVKAMANTLVPPRCDCGGVATAIVPGGRGVSQVQAARTTVSFRKVQQCCQESVKSAEAASHAACSRKRRAMLDARGTPAARACLPLSG